MVLESAGMLSLRVVVRASKSLVRDATGYRFEKLGVTSQGGPGGEVILNLPVTDQAGWKDPNLNALIDVSVPNSYTHQYTAQVDFTDADGNLVGISSIELGPFVVPTGDTVIDLDKNVPASTIAGGAVSIPDIWGQKIAEAEAVAAELQSIIPTTSAAVAAAVTTDGPAKQALNTTFVAVFDVRKYGATLDGVTDDGPALQAAMDACRDAGGGIVYVPPAGAFRMVVGQRIVHYSGIELRLGTGVYLVRKPGFYGYLIISSSTIPVRQIPGAVMAAGSATLTATGAAFTASDVGRYVTVPGALSQVPAGTLQPLVAKIASVTNGTTAVLDRVALESTNGVTVVVRNEDHDIALTGEPGATIVGGDTQTIGGGIGAGGEDAHHIYYKYVRRLKVSNLNATSTAGKYMFTIGAVEDWLVENIRLNSHSDGVNHSGPATRGRIVNISGTTGDDMVSFGAQQYMSHLDTAGDYNNIVVDGLYPVDALEALRFQGGYRMKLYNLTVRNVQGTVHEHGVLFSDDPTFPNDVGTEAYDIVAENIGVQSLGGGSGGYAAVTCTWETVRNMRISGIKITDTNTSGVSLHVGTYENVSISDIACSRATFQKMVSVSATAAVKNMVVSALRYIGAAGGLAINLSGPVDHLAVVAPRMDTGKSLVQTVSVLGRVECLGGLIGPITSGVVVVANSATGSVDASFVGVQQETNAPMVSVESATAGAILRGSGNSRSNMTIAAVARTGTQSLRVVGRDIPANVTHLTPALGDTCYNTSSAVSTGSGPVEWTGSHWRSTRTGALSGGNPSGATGAGAGSGATVMLSAAADDQSGQITVVTGASGVAASAAIATVTYTAARAAAPKSVTLQPRNAAAGRAQVWVSTNAAGNFVLASNTTPLEPSTTYIWTYDVTQ